MAYPSVTYTFTNGTTASATEVNQNFTDLINGLSDGTKDLSISALTCAGTATLNGAVNLGNATGDDIAVNGYITTALIPKTDDNQDLGTAALAWQDGYFDGAVYTDTISELTAAAGVTIDSALLKDGNFVPAANYGVDFSANTGATGETSSLLDWYEEGTWTPDLKFAGTGGATYAAQVGHYVRIGRMVNFSLYISITNNGAGTGSAAISGLPFTAASTANGGYSSCAIHGNNVSATNSMLTAHVQQGDTSILLYKLPTNSDGGGSTRLTEANIADSSSLIISGHYLV